MFTFCNCPPGMPWQGSDEFREARLVWTRPCASSLAWLHTQLREQGIAQVSRSPHTLNLTSPSNIWDRIMRDILPCALLDMRVYISRANHPISSPQTLQCGLWLRHLWVATKSGSGRTFVQLDIFHQKKLTLSCTLASGNKSLYRLPPGWRWIASRWTEHGQFTLLNSILPLLPFKSISLIIWVISFFPSLHWRLQCIFKFSIRWESPHSALHFIKLGDKSKSRTWDASTSNMLYTPPQIMWTRWRESSSAFLTPRPPCSPTLTTGNCSTSTSITSQVRSFF